jgi:metallo-beta-lactamase family protein
MTETIKAKVGFFGAVDAVTGSNFLFEVNGKRIMIDCGLFQGDKFSDERNHEKFLIDPSSVDVLLVTHAHIDHIGRIPKFVREGFKGVIYSTPPTEELTQIMLLDTVSILQREATRDGRSPIYVESDVRDTMKLWRTHEYYAPFEVMPQVQCEFKDAGHMLGSSMMFLTVNGTLMVFTGDLGNSPAPLLRDTDSIAGATYLLMESVYGDRNHEGREERKEILREAVAHSIATGGVLLIPAFSIERTQELLFELNELVEHHKLPEVKIYVDSPLAIKATEIYKRSDKYFNKETQHIIKSGDDVFKFPRLFFTETKQESMEIWETKGPKVIMAGSGMLNGGRIVHHMKHYAGDPNNAILLSGYQAVGTPGRRISEGERNITINGEHISVKAKVSTLHGYSGHKDMDHLVEFAEKGRETLKKVFVTIGEPKSSMFLAQRLRDYVGLNAVVPQPGDVVDLEF